jgi:3,4-dihydroxy 2-butanone 4-phosphate synthase / GTP cyclohydrolase II
MSTPALKVHTNALSSIDEILEDARNGRMFILVDDEDRENEGDLVVPAQMATPDAINFMARFGRGLICLALSSDRVEQLDLPLMAQANGTRHQTAFTVSIEAREGVTTGISAADRARTIAVAIDPTKGKHDLVTPGHVFPLMARDGGTLVRAGHTEAAVDIARMAGLIPAGVICEIMNDDGSMARLPDLIGFAQQHGLKVGTIADLIAYRRKKDSLVKCIDETSIETRFGGAWNLKIYVNTAEYAEHVVLVKGEIDPTKPVLVRMHAVTILDDMLGEMSGREGILQKSMQMIGEAGAGVVVIIRDTRPNQLSQILRRRKGDETAQGTVDVLREVGIGAQILIDLGLSDIILLSHKKHNVIGIDGYGLNIVEQRMI